MVVNGIYFGGAFHCHGRSPLRGVLEGWAVEAG